MNKDLILKEIDQISKQFLCAVPLRYFDWKNIFKSYLTEEIQEHILHKTVNSALVLKYPVKISYQKTFLKHLLNVLEDAVHKKTALEESVIHDELYSAYGRLVGTQDTFKAPLLATTASLALSEWITQNKNLFENKNILELGSGVGLTGIVLKQVCLVNNVYLTDCNEAVLKILIGNIKLNLINKNNEDSSVQETSDNKELDSRYVYTNEKNSIYILNLPWEKVSSYACKELGVIDKVIAADIVYDNSLFEPLVNAMKLLKENCGVQEFIFCCTERNPETLRSFLELIGEHFKNIKELPLPPQTNFLWPTDTPIKIYVFND